jgi:LmbE family N-acetylglucosaminyl deacetylase
MIEAVETALVLAPHTDDGEFGCGGTMARLVERGVDVRQIAFSTASRSLPPGFPPDTLSHESRAASTALGLGPDALTVHDFEVRTFPNSRQEILELLIEVAREFKPEVVLRTTSIRTTRPSPRRVCGRSSGRPCSATRSRGTSSASTSSCT